MVIKQKFKLSNSYKVCSMARVKLKECSEKYDFAIFELDTTFHNQFQSMYLV